MTYSNRITIQKKLIDRSNLKVKETVIISLKGEEILLIPDSKDLRGIKILGVRKIDEKGRILLPPSIVDAKSKWKPYLLDGQIYLTKKLIDD